MDFLEGDLENPKEINDNKIVVNKSIFFMSLNIVLYKTKVKSKYKKNQVHPKKSLTLPWKKGIANGDDVVNTLFPLRIRLFFTP